MTKTVVGKIRLVDQRPSILEPTADAPSRGFEHFNSNDFPVKKKKLQRFVRFVDDNFHFLHPHLSSPLSLSSSSSSSSLPLFPPPHAAAAVAGQEGGREDDDDAGPYGADGGRGGGRGGAPARGGRPRRAPGAAVGGGDPAALRRGKEGAPLPAQPAPNPRPRQDLR